MLGVAFDIQNDSLSALQIVNITNLSPTIGLSTFSPTYVIGANQVSDNGTLDPGFNTGLVSGSLTAFDNLQAYQQFF
jgi:hypothetical protein